MVTNNPQTHMEEEHLEVPGILEGLKAWATAEVAWKAANGPTLDKERKDTKNKVIGLVPKDGQPHIYRVEGFQIKVSPHEEVEVEFTKTAGERVTLKNVG